MSAYSINPTRHTRSRAKLTDSHRVARLPRDIGLAAEQDEVHSLSAERPSRQRDEFEALVLPLINRLYATAVHLIWDPVRAEDLVQETVLKAWQNFDRFRVGTRFNAWIYKILVYLYLNDRRHSNRREIFVDFSEQEPPLPEKEQLHYSSCNTNWETIYPDLVDDDLKEALEKLAPQQRSVFLFVTLGEMSYQECADALGIPIGTVMSRLFRARKSMQQELGQYACERGLRKKNECVLV